MFSKDYFEPWKTFQTPLVRQLAFAISSPNLIRYLPLEVDSKKNISLDSDHQWLSYYHAYEKRLRELDTHPQALNDFLNKIKSTRLGLRFEALLWFWLADPENHFFELLGHSIQSHFKGKTLGEIDFLIRHHQTQVIEHWEVCLKYYLAEHNLSLPTWIGLNPDDTFEHKLHHLVNKQFQFESALNYPIGSRKVIIKGQLYLPTSHATIPDWINPSRRLGNWLNTPPFHENFRRLARSEWLCPDLKLHDHPPTLWWTDGLYYNEEHECFTMLKLKHQPYIYPY